METVWNGDRKLFDTHPMNNETSVEIFKARECHHHKALYVSRQQNETAVHYDYLRKIIVRQQVTR